MTDVQPRRFGLPLMIFAAMLFLKADNEPQYYLSLLVFCVGATLFTYPCREKGG